jgi:hypothetical protein
LRNPPIGVSFLAQTTSESPLPPASARRRKSQRKSRDTPHHVALLFNATTHRNVEANLEMKEKALARLDEPKTKMRRYRPLA